uniref:Exo84_C domain-containing protein n=1 Tax=Steinernema glaseri TaxID=37863 RepID=A0A1I8ARD1_9BILA
MCGDERTSNASVPLHNGTGVGLVNSTPMQTLLQKLDGVATVLNSLKDSDRILLQHEVVQLDSDTMQPLHPVYLVLLTDRVLIGSPGGGASGSRSRFSLESTHQLSGLAAVNVKARGADGDNNVLKLLIFPEQRYFRCENPRVKRSWLEGVEQAKKDMLREGSLVRQETIRGKRRSVSEFAKTFNANRVTMAPSAISEEPNPEAEAEAAWLRELPSELEACIAQRDLEHAVELILEWKSCREACSDPAVASALETCEQRVVAMLSDDVRRPGALHGGPKAVRRAINQLASLGRTSHAIDMYLKRRSGAIRASAKELTVSEEPLSYVKQVSRIFVKDICDVASELSQAYPGYACLVLSWCCAELRLLLSLIRRHAIEAAPTTSVLAHTWRILMSECSQLQAAGLDLNFEVHRLLAPALKTALNANFNNIIESVRLRMQEERWKMYNMESESNVNRFLEEMADLKLRIDWAVSPTHRACICITQNACHFSRTAHSLARDLGLLKSSHLKALCDAFMITLWSEYLAHLCAAPPSDILSLTCQFIIGQVLPLCQVAYDPLMSSAQEILPALLEAQFPQLLQYAEDELGAAARRSVTSDFEDDDGSVAHI